MADLTIRIVTKYADAEKGFSKVAASLTKYRNELLKANAEGNVTEQMWLDYRQALQNALLTQDLTKEGMAALTGQARILGREVAELGMAFGETNEGYKGVLATFTKVKTDMKALGDSAGGASDGVLQIGKASDSTGLKLLSVAKNILKFQLLMGPITAVVRGFRNTLSDSVKVAAEAEQVFSKLNTVFEGFGNSAEKAASQLASAIGVATSTAASALSTVGDLLQAQGMGTSQSLSTASDWVRQFQDIIAFKDINMSLEEFAQNFMSGAAGNLRNFRTFGSIVKESAVNAELAKKGLDKLTGSQLELAKMTTRAEMALEQQANAMGATQREWDTMLSVGRRLSEQQKSLKENLGETINMALKPLKSRWAEVLEITNKCIKAANDYAKGVRDIPLFNVRENEEDRSMFRSALRNTPANLLKNNVSLANLQEGNFADEQYRSQLESIDRLLVMYNVSVSELTGYLSDWGYQNVLSSQSLENLLTLEKERNKVLEQTAKDEAQLAAYSSAASNYDSIGESIRSLIGAKGLGRMDFSNAYGLGYSEADMQNFLGMDIASALSSIKNTAKEVYGDVISGALDELDTAELLESKMADLRSLFEISWNALVNGLISEEQADLDSIKAVYLGVKAEIDAYNQSLKEQEERLQAIEDTKSFVESLYEQFADAEWERNTEAGFKAQGISDKELEVYMKYAKLQKQITDAYGKLNNLSKEELAMLPNMSEAEKALIEARQAELEAIGKTEDSMTDFTSMLLEGFGALAEVDAVKNFAGAIGSSGAGSLVNAGMQGGAAGGAWGAIIAILLELLSKTETFQELMSDDLIQPVVSMIDNLIKPMLPFIKNFTQTVNTILEAVLKPLFEPIKFVMQVIVIIGKVVNTIAAAVTNVGGFFHNLVADTIGQLWGMQRQEYVSIGDIWSDTNQVLQEIRDLTWDIKDNTEDDDSLLRAYNEMFRQNMINGNEYEALLGSIHGISYDRMRSTSGYAWQNGSGGTTIIYQDQYEIVVNGTNLSADEVAEAIERRKRLAVY